MGITQKFSVYLKFPQISFLSRKEVFLECAKEIFHVLIFHVLIFILNVILQNLVFTLYANGESIGVGHVVKHHLHDEVYGFDARTDIFQAGTKIGTLNCKSQ